MRTVPYRLRGATKGKCLVQRCRAHEGRAARVSETKEGRQQISYTLIIGIEAGLGKGRDDAVGYVGGRKPIC